MSRALAYCGHHLAALDRRDRFMAARDRPFAACDVFLARRCQCAWHVEDGEPAEDSLVVALRSAGCPVVGIRSRARRPRTGHSTTSRT